MNENDNVDTPLLTVVGVIAAVAVFAIIVGLQGLFLNMSHAVEQERTEGSSVPSVADMAAQQATLLNGFRWIDEKKGIVAVPITLAETFVLREYKSLAPTTSSERSAR